MILGIESSCDETSVAVAHQGQILSNVVASQVRLHSEYGGVVPELAVREHLKNLLSVAAEALRVASVPIEDIDSIAATRGPGLPAALMVGYTAARMLSFSRNLPFVGIHHHEAHLYSPWMQSGMTDWEGIPPHLGLIVSGGHTLLVHVRCPLDHGVLGVGSEVDDELGSIGHIEIVRKPTHFPRLFLN